MHLHTKIKTIKCTKHIISSRGLPICTTCGSEFIFEYDSPFADCDCGSTEWGNHNNGDYYRIVQKQYTDSELYDTQNKLRRIIIFAGNPQEWANFTFEISSLSVDDRIAIRSIDRYFRIDFKTDNVESTISGLKFSDIIFAPSNCPEDVVDWSDTINDRIPSDVWDRLVCFAGNQKLVEDKQSKIIVPNIDTTLDYSISNRIKLRN